MKNIWVLLFCLIFSTQTLASEARVVIDKVISALNGKTSSFQTDGCDQIGSEDWLKLLLADTPIQHKFIFKNHCDVEGSITLTKEPSPIDLQVRHLENISRLKIVLVTDLNPDISKGKIEIKMHGTKGQLFNAQMVTMKFHSDYKIIINIKGEVKQNRNGTWYVDQFQGQPLKLSVPFHIE